MDSKIELGPQRANRTKCGFANLPSPNGNCKECGEPAEPGPKKLCINCEIEKGMQPVKVEPEKAPETEK